MTHDDRTNAQLVAGVDEVGRGALFGPVVAGAVVLPETAISQLLSAGVTDSKKLSGTKRERLAVLIQTKALAIGLAAASVKEIDRLNILQASLLAMRRAVLKLSIQPDLCLVDGNQLIPDLPIPQQSIVKGDAKVLAIAAASIVAKVWRDNLIIEMANHYCHYDLVNNKGYGTARHRLAIQQFGPSAFHRLTFSPCGDRETTSQSSLSL